MKALSLTQPYAEQIKNGVKSIETRSWKTDYRGIMYIHASSTKIPKGSRENTELMKLAEGNDMDYGAIICSCNLVDCVQMTDAFGEDMKQNHSNEYLAGIYMLLFLICFVPVAFALWIYWQAMVICVRYISFYIKCAMIKKKNPELYRYLRNKEFRMTNGCGCSYWWLIHHHK